MGLHILIADARDITRMGLKNIVAGDPLVASIHEVTTSEELQKNLISLSPDLIVTHQSLLTDLTALAKWRFLILATEPDEKVLFTIYAHGACGYLLESSSVDLIRMALRLTQGMFLLDPHLTPWLLGCINKDILPVVTGEILTAREQEIFQLLRGGLTNRAIAGQLRISEATVKTHVASIFRKLAINRRSVVMFTPPVGLHLVQARS